MQGQKLSKVERERMEADKMKYALVSQRKKVEDELNKREEYHMPDQEPGQTMSKKYELLTARYRWAIWPAYAELHRAPFYNEFMADHLSGGMIFMKRSVHCDVLSGCSHQLTPESNERQPGDDLIAPTLCMVWNLLSMGLREPHCVAETR